MSRILHEMFTKGLTAIRLSKEVYKPNEGVCFRTLFVGVFYLNFISIPPLLM